MSSVFSSFFVSLLRLFNPCFFQPETPKSKTYPTGGTPSQLGTPPAFHGLCSSQAPSILIYVFSVLLCGVVLMSSVLRQWWLLIWFGLGAVLTATLCRTLRSFPASFSKNFWQKPAICTHRGASLIFLFRYHPRNLLV